MSVSIYLHIPFCRRLCPFCHFFRVPEIPEDWRPFFRAVKRELEGFGGDVIPSVRTLYVGGGTPTLFPPPFYAAVFRFLGERFDLSGLEEATIETDGEVAPKEMAGLAQAGFDRISIGVKSFLPRTREIMGIGGAPGPDPVSTARDAGFSSVSLDLVYAVEGQSLEDFEEDLRLVVDHRPDHVSLYCLEEGETAGPREGDPDVAAAMFRRSRRTMEEAGFFQYEITNFARQGHQSRHNTIYWQDHDYIGIGPSAHSSITRDGTRVRWRNRNDLPEYVKDPAGCREELSREDGIQRAREALILGLRMNRGVSRNSFAARYGFDPLLLLRPSLRELKEAGLVRFDARRIRLTTMGMLLSNEVFVEILESREDLKTGLGLAGRRFAGYVISRIS